MSNWNYWKELPYRGEPPDNTPRPRKPKRNRNSKEKKRDLVIGTVWVALIMGAIFCFLNFASDFQFDLFWKPALFFIGIFLIPFALSAGINAWNKYLQTDDLDEPKDTDEKQEE
jgi:hypothetical protein